MLGVMFCAPGLVFAASIKNIDTRSYELDIIAGSQRESLKVEPGASLTSFCSNGCVVSLNGVEDSEYKLEGGESLIIEEGRVYYDKPLAPSKTDIDKRENKSSSE